MYDHGTNEDVTGPVVHLAHQETATNRKRQVNRRGVGLGHLDSVERRVRTTVGNERLARHVVQGQEDTGSEHDDKRVEGDLTEHERPVVGEDLVEEVTSLGCANAVVELVEYVTDLAVRPQSRLGGPLRLYITHERSQYPGPTGSR